MNAAANKRRGQDDPRKWCHSRESGNPGHRNVTWIPVCTGMTAAMEDTWRNQTNSSFDKLRMRPHHNLMLSLSKHDVVMRH